MTQYGNTHAEKLEIEPDTLLLGSDGSVYRVTDGRLTPLDEQQQTTIAGLLALAQNPTQHFFKTPYYAAVYAVESSVVGLIRIHPSSFAPASPFDTFTAIERYYTIGEFSIPRFFLYPSGICNSSCGICQFRSLDRFKDKPRNERIIPLNVVKMISRELSSMRAGLKTVAVNVSGDGEPMQHPHFADILYRLKHDGFRIFLTTNLITDDEQALHAIVENVEMITVSIKGLNHSAYDHYQGRQGRTTFALVMRNLAILLTLLRQSGYRQQVLVGVATLLVPENTDYYRKMVERYVDLGIDYLYFNPVEPSYREWGITFTKRQRDETAKFLLELKSMDCACTIIRYPGFFYSDDLTKSIYYDSRLRDNIDLCGPAMWNPTIIATDTKGRRGARVLSCRSSNNFIEPNFWYADGECNNVNRMGRDLKATERDLLACALSDRHQDVMQAARDCSECRLERHVKIYDHAISLMKLHGFSGRFFLAFSPDDLVMRGRAIAFHETV